MHRGERVCRSVLFWQKTVRRGSRSGAPAPLRSGTAQTPTGQTPAAAPTCDPTFPGWPNVTTPTQHWANTGPTPATRHPDLKPHGRHTPPPADTYHRPAPRRPPVTGPTFPQPPRRPNPHRQPLDSHYPPLGGPRCNQAPSSGEAPTCGHLPPTNPRQPPITGGNSSPARRHPGHTPSISRPSPTQRPPPLPLSSFGGSTSTAARHRHNAPSATPSAPSSAATTLPSAAPPALHQTAGKKEAPPQGGA